MKRKDLRKSFQRMLLSALICAAGSQAASAECTIASTGGTFPTSPLSYWGQTFTTTCSGNVTQVTFEANDAASYGITATIRTSCHGTALGTGTTTGNVVKGTNTITFSGLSLAASTVYALEFTRTGGGNVGGLMYNSFGTYSGGEAFIPNCNFLNAHQGDLNFSVTIAQPTCTMAASGGKATSGFSAYTGQTFTPTCSGNLSQVTFETGSDKAYGITATIRTGCHQSTILGTATTAGNAVKGTNTITFSGVSLTAGTVYALELARTGGGNIDGIVVSTNNSYPAGESYSAPNCNTLAHIVDLNFSVTVGNGH